MERKLLGAAVLSAPGVASSLYVPPEHSNNAGPVKLISGKLALPADVLAVAKGVVVERS